MIHSMSFSERRLAHMMKMLTTIAIAFCACAFDKFDFISKIGADAISTATACHICHYVEGIINTLCGSLQ